MRLPLYGIYLERGKLYREHLMPNARHHPILNYLRQVLGASASSGVSDADLLNRFVKQHDEAAFELLLWRHAAMVLHVCRQVLGNGDAAEDAFQATFLVFVRKAGSITRRDALGSWLYRVADRIALKARTRSKTRTSAPVDLDRPPGPMEGDAVAEHELRRIICEEVDRLPAKYRAPIVACFFEGKTHEEAAKQLGWPLGTVAGRLARARELLRRRLLRRGVTLTMSALLAALTARTAQAALTRLVDSVIHTSRLLAAGQAAGAVVSPYVAALAEGVLQTMIWTHTKVFAVVLFVVCLGGVGVSLLATQEVNHPMLPNGKMPMLPKGMMLAQVARGPVATPPAPIEPAQYSDEDDEVLENPAPEEKAPEDAAKLAHDMARSRLNLKKLALAMHNFSDTHQGQLPPAALTGNNGKALLSWRVALLPFLGEQELFRQFKFDEPWNSPHNRKLLSKMPAVFAPPGVKTHRTCSTFYQVFVSASSTASSRMSSAAGGAAPAGAGGPGMTASPSAAASSQAGGGPGMGPTGSGTAARPGGRMRGSSGGMQAGGRRIMMGGMGPGATAGGMPWVQREHFATAFVKGEATRFPAHIPDGTSNTILIVEAGNPVPWTKPEDLHYADDEPLPELGGLFPNVFHAAFADGAIHTLTKNYSEKQLRLAITANDGTPQDFAKIEARSPHRAGAANDEATVEAWQRKNDMLRKDLEQARQQIRLLKEEQEVERELAGEDPRVNKLKDEHARMQSELKKMRAEIEALKKGIPSGKSARGKPSEPRPEP